MTLCPLCLQERRAFPEICTSNSSIFQAVLDGVASLKVREGAFDALNKGSGALEKRRKVVAPSGAPPEELYDFCKTKTIFVGFSFLSDAISTAPRTPSWLLKDERVMS